MPDVQPEPATAGGRDHRKRRGAFATPLPLVRIVIDGVLPQSAPGTVVTILDPACGDGRFLVEAARVVVAAGARPILFGLDIHAAAVASARAAIAMLRLELGAAGDVEAHVHVADALAYDWGDRHFDVVLGNPPYLSQLAAHTTRRGASALGGGPYADAAGEFLALAVRLARPGGGRVGLVLPQSILSSRDVGPIRATVERDATMCWSWFSPARHFDANVVVCALGFERRPATEQSAVTPGANPTWTDVVTAHLGVPPLPRVDAAGELGDRATAMAGFRDEYYGLLPGVGEHATGPPLITSGLIDPGHVRWGERPATIARQRRRRPRLDVDALSPAMRRWVARLLVPKVLVANQTRVVECVADPEGSLLPTVPVVTVLPGAASSVWEIAAVLTSPVASVSVWHRAAGAGMSARAVRIGPRLLEALPWPAGPLDEAVARLRAGDVTGCGRAVDRAYGVDDDGLHEWWSAGLPGHGVRRARIARARGAARLAAMIRSRLPVLVLAGTVAFGVAACGGDDNGGDAAGAGGDAAQRGAQLAKDKGCQSCHRLDGDGIGPTWVGLYGSTVTLVDGSTVVADDDYLHQAINDPSSQKVAGYDVAMPDNSLSADQIDDVIAYIRSLADGGAAATSAP